MCLTFNLQTSLFQHFCPSQDSKKNEMSSVAMYTEWHFPYWGRGKGSHIGVVVRAQVSQHMRWGFQSLLGTSTHYINKKIINVAILCIPDIKIMFNYIFFLFGSFNINPYSPKNLSFIQDNFAVYRTMLFFYFNYEHRMTHG